MSLRDSLIDDWQLFDDYETVTVEDTDNFISITVKGCQSNEISKQQLQNPGFYGQEIETMSFSLPIENMGDFELKQGHVIVEDNGDRWLVNSCFVSTLGTRYKASTTKMVI